MKVKIQNKTYTFKIVNKSGKNAEATVALKKYVDYTEEYTNAPSANTRVELLPQATDNSLSFKNKKAS